MKHEFKVQSVASLLPDVYGNVSELARRLNISRQTLTYHLDDHACLYHCILNGVFMSIPRPTKGRTVFNKNVPTSKAVDIAPTKRQSNRVEEAKKEARRIGFL